MNTMSLENTKKMLLHYKGQLSNDDFTDELLDRALQMGSVEEIISYLNVAGYEHYSSYIKLIDLYESLHEKSILAIDVVKKSVDKYGRTLKQSCKLYTVLNGEINIITRETAFALGYEFAYLKSAHGYEAQMVLVYPGYYADLVKELSQLLFNAPDKLLIRSV